MQRVMQNSCLYRRSPMGDADALDAAIFLREAPEISAFVRHIRDLGRRHVTVTRNRCNSRA